MPPKPIPRSVQAAAAPRVIEQSRAIYARAAAEAQQET
jgi:hypothetical protein